jgi:DNA-binding MarR family transcriptional regulator
MTHSGESTPAERDSGLDHLVRSLDRAGRASNRVLVRWLSDADVPLLSACVLFALDPEDGPVGMGDVAEAIGISVDDAARALHELRSLGYARENGRQYESTEKGERLLGSLASARREALAAFPSGLSEAERREFVAILGDPDWT